VCSKQTLNNKFHSTANKATPPQTLPKQQPISQPKQTVLNVDAVLLPQHVEAGPELRDCAPKFLALALHLRARLVKAAGLGVLQHVKAIKVHEVLDADVNVKPGLPSREKGLGHVDAWAQAAL